MSTNEFLKGVRVLDASHVVAGPFATYQLALMGADVIRIDRVTGNDFVRYHGGTEDMRKAGLGASFIAQNAGKSCIQLDYKDARGKSVFKRLAETCDVVIENFRPGVMDRLGLGYNAIRAVKPDVIYCSLTGYGPEGPMRDAPAYDHIVQGVSGLMSTTGTSETGPLRSGVPITDYLTGYNGALAVMSALFHHRVTGEGQHLQVTMLASTLPVLGAALVDVQTTGNVRDLMGNQPFSDSPFSGRFDCREGQLMMTANTAQQATALIEELGIDTLADELAVVVKRGELTEQQKQNAAAALRSALATDTAQNWVDRLSRVSVPAGKVASLRDVGSNEQLQAIGNMDKVITEGRPETVDVPGLAYSSSLSDERTLPAPERAGQSTGRILGEIGIDKDEINELARTGVIAGPDLPTA